MSLSAADMEPDVTLVASVRLFKPEGVGLQKEGVAREIPAFQMEVGVAPDVHH